MIITEKKIESLIKKLRFKFPYSAKDYFENMYFENYHCHTDFSNTSTPDSGELLDGYVNRIKKLNGKCLYSGEHGSQGNWLYVYKTAEENSLKYRHSAEAYWVKDRLKEYTKYDEEGNPAKDAKGKIKKSKDSSNCHIMIISKNNEGKGDLNYALSIANEDGHYHKARIDMELLLNIPKDNVIVTTACLAGWKYEDAEDCWLKLAKHFGDNFFVELQYHDTDKQRATNKRALDFAKKHNLQIICGLDSHYIDDKSSIKRDQILKYKKVKYPEEDGWYLDYPDVEEIIKRFEKQGVLTDDEILISIMNTNVFVNGCEEIKLDRSFKIPSIYKDKTYKEKCKIFKNKLNVSYKKEKLKSKEKAAGIRWEVEQIVDSGTVDYFLTSEAIVKKGINEYGGILTTTSRGSAASFVTNKLIGLTTVDRFNAEIPIYPERFLTKERVLSGQMPDIDLNIATAEPFVKAAKDIVGEHGCYPLMAVEKLKEKAAWQLYAGANDVKPTDANMISKFLDEYNKALKYTDEEDRDLIHVEDFIPNEYLDLYRQSLEYQGIAIKLKVHACGNLIFDGDIRREIGLITATSDTTGKRTLCAAVEGKYLDDFGYVKEDFLIVDSSHLTHKLFESIGQTVPSFEELREMVDGDKKTWEIYEKGITCCVNQCEKASTTNKVKKYKPKNIAELAAFIAGIRPGFSSLINNFLNREKYSTGEFKIDTLLKDSYCYMLYQESIMKVLSFLGLKMADTYGVIKSISKKKLEGEKKDNLLNNLKDSWFEIFHYMDNFDNIWRVIEDSAHYAFNAPHAYSMAGDSLYQAWFKAHHTAKFYEIAITHYQEKGKKDKIDALVKEALKFYGFKLGEYEFGKDNRVVNIDEKQKIIYPNLSSVKGFGEKVVNSLYELGKNDYPNFISLLKDIKSTPVDKTTLKNLVRINYFKKYGSMNKLLKIIDYYNLFGEAKEISKEKCIKNNIPVELVVKFGRETQKKIKELRTYELINSLIDDIKDSVPTTKEMLDNQKDVIGILTYIDPAASKRLFYVSELEVNKYIVNVKLYEINSGILRDLKMWRNQYDYNVFEEKDVLKLYKTKKKNKREPNGEINPKNGKKIYVDVPNKYEIWLENYVVESEYL